MGTVQKKRKCKKCSKDITSQDLPNVVLFESYYHEDCFIETVKEKKRSKKLAEAFKNIDKLKADAKEKILWWEAKDALANHLVENYDMVVVPGKFWTTVSDLESGIYRGAPCKKVPATILYEAWNWMQNELNKINANNKLNHKGPSTDEQRIMYDLAIVLNRIPKYIEHKNMSQTIEDILFNEAKNKNTSIDYSDFERNINDDNYEEDDVFALLDELF